MEIMDSPQTDPKPDPVIYICGDCGEENSLMPGGEIKCRECGFRILYKKRNPTRKEERAVQYAAI